MVAMSCHKGLQEAAEVNALADLKDFQFQMKKRVSG